MIFVKHTLLASAHAGMFCLGVGLFVLAMAAWALLWTSAPNEPVDDFERWYGEHPEDDL